MTYSNGIYIFSDSIEIHKTKIYKNEGESSE